jgi:hypothetical protein
MKWKPWMNKNSRKRPKGKIKKPDLRMVEENLELPGWEDPCVNGRDSEREGTKLARNQRRRSMQILHSPEIFQIEVSFFSDPKVC